MSDTLIIIFGSFLVVLLIFLSSCFSFAEIALASSNQIRLKIYEKKASPKKSKRAKRVLRFIDNYNQMSITIVVLNNVINILATTISAALFNFVFSNNLSSFLMSFLVMTILIILFGELIPKMLAKKYAEKGTMFFSFALEILNKLLKPLTYFLQFLVKQDKTIPIKNEEELKVAISEAEKIGITSKDERNIIDAALKFDAISAKDIMIKKNKVGFIYSNDSEKIILKKLKENDFTRFPVLNKNSKVLYVLNAKKYLFDYLEDKNVELKTHLYSIQKFYSDTPVQKILNKLKNKREKIAAIVDKNQSFIGIITIEDIVEVLVGKIYDEFDKETDEVYRIEEKTYIVMPDVNVQYFFKNYLPTFKLTKIPKTITFLEWVYFLTKKNELKIGEKIFYRNLIIWVKEDTHTNKKIIFEIDIL